MLVGVEPGPVIAAVCELGLRFEEDNFDIHAGIAGGHVLLFEGDDYIGPAANHAARLCEAADAGEILALGVAPHLPSWVRIVGETQVQAHGLGLLPQVSQLEVVDLTFDKQAAG
jgi:class 3 adenylate cyclase